LQANLEIPLPASTQWEIVSAAAPGFEPVLEELIRQAADGEVVHHDDTNVRILKLMGKGARQEAFAESNVEDGAQSNAEDGAEVDPASRKGLFTSGVVAISGDVRIVLFFSGPQHAGENLRDVLRRGATDLPPPIQMCDALSRNMPDELQMIIANFAWRMADASSSRSMNVSRPNAATCWRRSQPSMRMTPRRARTTFLPRSDWSFTKRTAGQ
jgi:hypothetical protein